MADTTSPAPPADADGHGELAATVGATSAQTVEIPSTDPARSAETVELVPAAAISEPEAPRPRKRRRLRGWLIALGITAVLVVVAWFVGDTLLRDYAKTYVREQIITAFELEPDVPMDVEIGPGSLIAQAIGGSIDSVDVEIPNLALGEITGDLSVALGGIPLNGDDPVDTLRLSVSVDEDEVGKLGGYLSDADLTTIDLAPNEIVVQTKFDLFGTEIPLSLSLEPSAIDGGISFSPKTVTVNNSEISLDDVRDGPFGALASGLLDSGTFCVAEYLPRAITLTDVTVSDTALVLSAEGDGTPLGSADLSTFGTCD